MRQLGRRFFLGVSFVLLAGPFSSGCRVGYSFADQDARPDAPMSDGGAMDARTDGEGEGRVDAGGDARVEADTSTVRDGGMDATVASDAGADVGADTLDATADSADDTSGDVSTDTGTPLIDGGLMPTIPLTNLPRDTFTRISSPAILWDSIIRIDTDRDCDFVHPQGGLTQDICVIGGESVLITVGARVTFTGRNAVALVARRTLDVMGTVDASAVSSASGPGAPGVAPPASMSGDGGSGGHNGSEGRVGGRGRGPGGLTGLFTGPPPSSPLVGGQNGGSATGMFGISPGGGGGGALQFSAGDAIRLGGRARIHANGGGGRGGLFDGEGGSGGSGGGAGGTIFFESRMLTLEGTTVITANGAGGGGGGSTLGTGLDGADGSIGVDGGSGGAPSESAGRGGSGAGLPRAASTGDDGMSGDAGGGGGGGIGRIGVSLPVVFPFTPAGTAIISPAHTRSSF